VGAVARFGTADRDGNPRRFEQIIGNQHCSGIGAGTSSTRRAHGFHRSYPGRNRHWQRTYRPRDSRFEFTGRTSVHKAELWQPFRLISWKASFLGTKGRLHGGCRAKGWSFRIGRQGNTFPGRGGRYSVGASAQTAASPAGAGV